MSVCYVNQEPFPTQSLHNPFQDLVTAAFQQKRPANALPRELFSPTLSMDRVDLLAQEIISQQAINKLNPNPAILSLSHYVLPKNRLDFLLALTKGEALKISQETARKLTVPTSNQEKIRKLFLRSIQNNHFHVADHLLKTMSTALCATTQSRPHNALVMGHRMALGKTDDSNCKNRDELIKTMWASLKTQGQSQQQLPKEFAGDAKRFIARQIDCAIPAIAQEGKQGANRWLAYEACSFIPLEIFKQSLREKATDINQAQSKYRNLIAAKSFKPAAIIAIAMTILGFFMSQILIYSGVGAFIAILAIAIGVAAALAVILAAGLVALIKQARIPADLVRKLISDLKIQQVSKQSLPLPNLN